MCLPCIELPLLQKERGVSSVAMPATDSFACSRAQLPHHPALVVITACAYMHVASSEGAGIETSCLEWLKQC